MSNPETTNTRCRSCCSGKSDLSATGWQSRYDKGKTGWDRGESNPMLRQWIDSGKLKPCRILVPGCGRGHEAISLAAAGFDVTAVDFAPTAVILPLTHCRSASVPCRPVGSRTMELRR